MADFSICDISRLAKYGVHDKPVSTYTFKLWCLQFAAIGSIFNLVHVRERSLTRLKEPKTRRGRRCQGLERDPR